jgi:hypothetical protein
VALYVALRAFDPRLALLATVGRLFHAAVRLRISINLCTALRSILRFLQAFPQILSGLLGRFAA